MFAATLMGRNKVKGHNTMNSTKTTNEVYLCSFGCVLIFINKQMYVCVCVLVQKQFPKAIKTIRLTIITKVYILTL